MNMAPQVRLHLFYARDSDRAVILRQGPSKQYRMILWHRDSGRFEDGQWLKSRVYVDGCSLSPDGRHFLYFTLDGRWRSPAKGSFTAVSQPPYWTALALFAVGDTWSGGGVFLDNVHYLADGETDQVGRATDLARVLPGEVIKGCSTGLRLISGQPAPLARQVTAPLLEPAPPKSEYELHQRAAQLNQAQDPRFRAEEGRLYRVDGAEPVLLRDFTDMAFSPIRAPYDWRDQGTDPDPTPWHPLDGENA